MDKRVAAIGAGAIGGCTGGPLAPNGFDATLIDPSPEHIEAVRKDRLALDGVMQQESAVPRCKTMHLTEMQQLAKQKPIGIALVAGKPYDTAQA